MPLKACGMTTILAITNDALLYHVMSSWASLNSKKFLILRKLSNHLLRKLAYLNPVKVVFCQSLISLYPDSLCPVHFLFMTLLFIFVIITLFIFLFHSAVRTSMLFAFSCLPIWQWFFQMTYDDLSDKSFFSEGKYVADICMRIYEVISQR